MQGRKPKVTRRHALKALATASAVGLAGCADDGDSGGEEDLGQMSADELGERVPDPLVLEYWSNMGAETTMMEQYLPIVQEGLEKAFDLGVEVRPVEFTTQVNNIIQDKRTHHLATWYHTNTPDRLDPHEMTRRFGIDWAGGNGRANPVNYASCEYTAPAVEQESAASEDDRQKFVTEAHKTIADDVAVLPFLQTLDLGAANTETMNLKAHETAGVIMTNPHVYINSEPTEGDRFATNVGPTYIETTNFPVHDSSEVVSMWSHLIHSTLTEYDENLKVTNVLAEDYQVEDDGRKITVTLRDATFHDGEPITAEDVRFTFKHMWDNAESFPHGSEPPYESIDVVDEKTAVFNFSEPFLALITREWPRWGILHSQRWIEGGASDDPDGFNMDPVVGSGPFKVSAIQIGEYVELDPHDGHPVHQPEHGIDVEVYRDSTAETEAFLGGQIDLYAGATPGALQRIEEEMGDQAETVYSAGFMPHNIYPQFNVAPTKFKEFRLAVGHTLDIDLMNEVAWLNQGTPNTVATVFQHSHPFREDNWEDELTNFTSDTSGDIEAARQILTDAGWGWDEEGNLRYPKDADVSALWPKGGTPADVADEYPCLDSNGEYQHSLSGY